jgi:hypothetical protein
METQVESVFEPSAQILKVFGYHNSDELLNDGDLFSCDPDYLKLNGNKIPFIGSGLWMDNKQYVLYYGEPDNKISELLCKFYNSDKIFNHNIPQTWDKFDKSSNAIAYRGGSGYIYSISSFEEV